MTTPTTLKGTSGMLSDMELSEFERDYNFVAAPDAVTSQEVLDMRRVLAHVRTQSEALARLTAQQIALDALLAERGEALASERERVAGLHTQIENQAAIILAERDAATDKIGGLERELADVKKVIAEAKATYERGPQEIDENFDWVTEANNRGNVILYMSWDYRERGRLIDTLRADLAREREKVDTILADWDSERREIAAALDHEGRLDGPALAEAARELARERERREAAQRTATEMTDAWAAKVDEAADLRREIEGLRGQVEAANAEMERRWELYATENSKVIMLEGFVHDDDTRRSTWEMWRNIRESRATQARTQGEEEPAPSRTPRTSGES